MLKKILGLASLLALVLLSSCGGYEKTESGLRYKILSDSTGGVAPEAGGAVFVKMQVSATGGEKDTIVFEYQPTVFRLFPKYKKGTIEEGLFLLTKGDSAEFLINLDSFYTVDGKPQPKEPWATGQTDLKFIVKITKFVSAKEVQEMERLNEEQQKAQMQQRVLAIATYKQELLAADSNKAQVKKDEGIIKAYLAKNKIKAERSPNGIYYAVTTKGTGAAHVAGDTIAVHYTGKLMDGTVFDSSLPRNQPIEFVVGVGQVILGWDEAMTILHVGDKATIFIPSLLAYGPKGSPPVIPGNSVLMFEVEIVK